MTKEENACFVIDLRARNAGPFIICSIGSHFERRIDWILAAMFEKADSNSDVESAE